MGTRQQDLNQFYGLLDDLKHAVGGPRHLESASGRDGWPARGVYFFFQPDEHRQSDGRSRVVRVGTHGLRPGSGSTLWGRLRQHHGTTHGDALGGNHRGSVFRLHVGLALAERHHDDDLAPATWASGSSAPRDVRTQEAAWEARVSQVIGAMSVLWVAVPDEPGPHSLRGYLERNCIALLSNHDRDPIDPPSPHWLGHYARAPQIRSSGLWNVNHTTDTPDTEFLDVLAATISRTA
jgi:hypothetical protein